MRHCLRLLWNACRENLEEGVTELSCFVSISAWPSMTKALTGLQAWLTLPPFLCSLPSSSTFSSERVPIWAMKRWPINDQTCWPRLFQACARFLSICNIREWSSFKDKADQSTAWSEGPFKYHHSLKAVTSCCQVHTTTVNIIWSK